MAECSRGLDTTRLIIARIFETLKRVCLGVCEKRFFIKRFTDTFDGVHFRRNGRYSRGHLPSNTDRVASIELTGSFFFFYKTVKVTLDIFHA